MFLQKYYIAFACFIALAVAFPSEGADVSIQDEHNFLIRNPVVHQTKEGFVRKVRSPEGSIDLTYKDDRAGREASIDYNQKIYKSDDGRVNVDAYAHGTRNFDYNRNDYGAGIRGSIRF